MSAIPTNPAYGYGFGTGTRCCTHTHTQTYPWTKPGRVLKPVPITSGVGRTFSFISLDIIGIHVEHRYDWEIPTFVSTPTLFLSFRACAHE